MKYSMFEKTEKIFILMKKQKFLFLMKNLKKDGI